LQLVCWLVYWVVSRDPSILLVSCCTLLPQPDDSILVVFEAPKCCTWSGVVGMPILVVSSREGVQVEDSINSLLGTLISKINE
jgi:hypothetical protein